MSYQVTLKKDRERSVLLRHPWIFSGALEEGSVNIPYGETVQVKDFKGASLALGSYSPESQIRVRIWSFDPDEKIDESFFRKKISDARAFRENLCIDADSFRVINAENDRLPGIIVDKYNEFLVCSFLSAGAEKWKDEVISILSEEIPCKGIYERSDSSSRQKEGLPDVKGCLCGEEPPGKIEIREGRGRFLVDVRNGHKTGFYLDQRENRAVMLKYASGTVLNCFSYTGGFGVSAALGNADKVINLDSSEDALLQAEENFILNGIPREKFENLKGNAFEELRKFRDRGMSFDAIILDPPKLAESKGQTEKASRAYKDLNLLAFKLLKPGGSLFSFSCSGNISGELFRKIVFSSALDAEREAKIVQTFTQSPCHAVSLSFPEGLYLKGFHCIVS